MEASADRTVDRRCPQASGASAEGAGQVEATTRQPDDRAADESAVSDDSFLLLVSRGDYRGY